MLKSFTVTDVRLVVKRHSAFLLPITQET